jgi:hypothetical protein
MERVTQRPDDSRASSAELATAVLIGAAVLIVATSAFHLSGLVLLIIIAAVVAYVVRRSGGSLDGVKTTFGNMRFGTPAPQATYRQPVNSQVEASAPPTL